MPREITDRELVLNTVRNLEITAELFEEQNGKPKFAGDLEVIIHGRDYGNGKQVGPYVRLLTYDPREEVMRQGEWGGNTFYIAVQGSLDVFVRDGGGGQLRINQIQAGTVFGEMAVLAGVERNATIAASEGDPTLVLEVTRPALRLLRKLPKFGQLLDETYRRNGFGRVLADLEPLLSGPSRKEVVEKFRQVARFMVYGKHHVLCLEGTPIDKVILIKSGWARRSQGMAFDAASTRIVMGAGQSTGVDFLGAGNCLGLEGTHQAGEWKYSATLMTRSEVLEIPLPALIADPALRDQIVSAFAAFSNADDNLPVSIAELPDLRLMASAEEEIVTGIVDGANLLVMDMDLCVRCGNCSLACHKVHGQSRLLRRGISITRPKAIGLATLQHALIPQVCMHCKDPECLTGCPTGAIFRDPRGQVDINPATCIGCFDCATQCPYDAISMVPRDSPTAADVGLFARLKRRLRIMSAPATESDDVVAIKCNLCEHTPLNPAGATLPAYSCEENCPTGALVRIDPIEYFSEIKAARGFVFRDETHAVGRNIHKSDPWANAWHLAGLILIMAAASITLVGLVKHGLDGRIGGTFVTIRWITGLSGLFGIAVVMTYPLRKQIYRRRVGPLRYWLLMHSYVGGMAGVLLMFHGGTHTGGLLTTSLYVAFDFVILSGLFGIGSYLVAPRIMTSIEGDPLLIEDLVDRRKELREELTALEAKAEGGLRDQIRQKVSRRFLSFGFLLRQIIRREELKALLAEARQELKDQTAGLTVPTDREIFLTAVETTVTIRRVDALIALHRLLRVWILPHVISTTLMLALMAVHILQVVFFTLK